ncbi:hypothetical protein OWM07_10865 [Deferribacter thermophilus]|uniref:hypothetical protein n=1 Tax=Deferribacter thermophilus TaxID=53573 RepID=UPI003C245E7D
MKRLLGGLLIMFMCISGSAMAIEKGDFSLGLGYKNVEFDTANDTDADLVGLSLNYHAGLTQAAGMDVNLNLSLGYYYGEMDIEGYAGDDPNIENVSFAAGVGVSKDFGKLTAGLNVNGTFDHFDIEHSDNLDPFGIGGDIYATYVFGKNHNIGIKAEYIKFLSEDDLDYSVGAGITYGFKF